MKKKYVNKKGNSAKSNRFFTFIIVSIFVLLTFSPLLLTAFKITLTSPLDENRERLTKPEGNTLAMLWTDTEYKTNMENYFNDHYTMRDLLIKMKNQIDYSLFHSNDGLYIGNDDYLFYKSVINGEQVANERMSDEKFESMCSKFVEVKKMFAEKGIEFFVMVAPQKNTIYPELLPNNPVKRPEITAYDRLTTFFETNEDMKGRTLNVKETLKEATAIRPVFYKADFHWNPFGAAYAAKGLVELINEKLGSNVAWRYEIEPSENPDFMGGQNKNLANFTMKSEIEYDVVNNWTTNMQDSPIYKELTHKVTLSETEELLPPMLLLENSYGGTFRLIGYYEHFSESYRLHHRQIELPQPDNVKIVVLQLIESDIYRCEAMLNKLLGE